MNLRLKDDWTRRLLAVAAACLLLFPLLASSASAQGGKVDVTTGQRRAPEELPVITEIVIPGEEIVSTSAIEGRLGGFFVGKVRDLADYIQTIYNWLIGIAGLVTGTMIVVGGFQYLTAGGDKGRVEKARSRITNALIGLVLVLSAYVLLNTINPALVNLKSPTAELISPEFVYIPWCEDLAATGFNVVPVKKNRIFCGDIGEYTDKKGKQVFCIYVGGIANRWTVNISGKRGDITDTQSKVETKGRDASEDADEDSGAGGAGASGSAQKQCQKSGKSCTNDAECGDKGPCEAKVTKYCRGSGNLCKNDAECGDKGPCEATEPISDARIASLNTPDVSYSDFIPISHMSTCMQVNFDYGEFQRLAKRWKESEETQLNKIPPHNYKFFARKMSCTDFGVATPAQRQNLIDFGYDITRNESVAKACSTWMFFANDFPKPAGLQGKWTDSAGRPSYLDRFWNYCVMSDPTGLVSSVTGGPRGCVNAFVDCEAVNINEDDDSDDKEHAGCEGYDESPDPCWRLNDDNDHECYKVLDRTKKHLAAMCAWNPCQYYNSNKAVRNDFLGGCDKGRGIIGLLDHIPAARGILSGDCRNPKQFRPVGTFCKQFPAQCK
jgi:hypothetical protein